jgi:hypothetical protein
VRRVHNELDCFLCKLRDFAAVPVIRGFTSNATNKMNNENPFKWSFFFS